MISGVIQGAGGFCDIFRFNGCMFAKQCLTYLTYCLCKSDTFTLGCVTRSVMMISVINAAMLIL